LSVPWLRRAAWLLVLTAAAASGEGCGKPVLRVADASLGDYYSDKEFKKLSQEQRAEYCAELARQDSVYKGEILSLKEEMDQTQGRSLRLRAEGDSLFAVGTALEGRNPGREGSRGARHVVRRGESLWAISASPDVFGKGNRWRALFESNRAHIKNPDVIYPGQELSIPR
jgi:nucleoid-associated protein YgaU